MATVIISCAKSAMPRGNFPKLGRMQVPRMPTLVAARYCRPGGFLVPPHATVGGGGSDGCYGGPPPTKRTGDDDDSVRPSTSKPLLANKTLLAELVGPTAMLLGLYTVSVSIWNLGRGSVGCKPGVPLTTVLNRGVKVAEHVTVKNGETQDAFSKIVLAVALGAGASNATGQSTTTTIISGLTAFGMVVWASSFNRRKGV